MSDAYLFKIGSQLIILPPSLVTDERLAVLRKIEAGPDHISEYEFEVFQKLILNPELHIWE